MWVRSDTGGEGGFVFFLSRMYIPPFSRFWVFETIGNEKVVPHLGVLLKEVAPHLKNGTYLKQLGTCHT